MQPSKQLRHDFSHASASTACPINSLAPPPSLWLWRWRRLARMTPAEAVHRVREALTRRALRRRRFGWEAFPARGNLDPLPALTEPLRGHAALAPAMRLAAADFRNGAFAALGAVWPPRDPPFPPELW